MIDGKTKRIGERRRAPIDGEIAKAHTDRSRAAGALAPEDWGLGPGDSQ